MAIPNLSNDSTGIDRRKRLDVVRIKLSSQRPSDIFGGILEIKKWLQENIEDQEIYEILLDSVRENPGLRQEVRDLLEEMIQKGSKSAGGALRVLPADIKDMMIDADDAYYTGDYEQAIELYQKVLQQDPNNVRAKEQIAKSELNRIAGRPDSDLPRAAIQYFRRARSHIAAKDFGEAMNFLTAALEAAKAQGKDFPEAENLLNSMQDLWTADEYKSKGEVALKKEQWASAYDSYNKAYLLNPQDQVIKRLLEALDGLMRADALLDSLSEPPKDEKEREEKLEKIDAFLKQAEEIKVLVSTSLLKESRARYNQLQGKSPKAWFVSRRALLTVVILLVAILGSVSMLVWQEWTTENHPSPLLSNPTPTPTISVVTSTFTPAPTFTAPPTIAATVTVAATEPLIPVVSATDTSAVTPTVTPFAYGQLTKSVNAVEDPKTGKLLTRVEVNQVVTVLGQDTVGGYEYYECIWEANGVMYDGWILKIHVSLVPITPTPGG